MRNCDNEARASSDIENYEELNGVNRRKQNKRKNVSINLKAKIPKLEQNEYQHENLVGNSNNLNNIEYSESDFPNSIEQDHDIFGYLNNGLFENSETFIKVEEEEDEEIRIESNRPRIKPSCTKVSKAKVDSNQTTKKTLLLNCSRDHKWSVCREQVQGLSSSLDQSYVKSHLSKMNVENSAYAQYLGGILNTFVQSVKKDFLIVPYEVVKHDVSKINQVEKKRLKSGERNVYAVEPGIEMNLFDRMRVDDVIIDLNILPQNVHMRNAIANKLIKENLGTSYKRANSSTSCIPVYFECKYVDKFNCPRRIACYFNQRKAYLAFNQFQHNEFCPNAQIQE